MKAEHKAFLGFVIFFSLIVAYAVLATALDNYGLWVWVPIGLAAIAFLAALLRFPSFRGWFGAVVLKGGFEAVAELFSGGGGTFSEREAVPPAMRQQIFRRANHRCQFPACRVSGRKNLDIHHIDMDSSNSKDNANLIAVCPTHHRQIHNEGTISTRQVRRWAVGDYAGNQRQTPVAYRRR